MKLLKKWSPVILASTVLLSVMPHAAFAFQDPHPYQPAETSLNKSNLQKTMTVQSFEKLENGVKLNLGGEEAYIRLLSSDIAKISLLNKGDKETDTPGVDDKKKWPTPKYKVNETDKKIVISTDDLTVDIQKSPFGIKYLDKDGKVINEDGDQGIGYENGKPYVFKKTDKNENFYGFGEHTGKLNKRGQSLGMWNSDVFMYTKDTKYMYSDIPFFIGLKNKKAYGIYFDNSYHSYFNMANESDDYYYFYADGGKLTYYFINGPEIKDVVNRYTDITGKMELPPEWALGLQQSKWYYSQDMAVKVAQTYRDKKIPMDTINMDIEYMDGYRVFTWGKPDSQYPDADKLNEDFNRLHVHTVAINDPGVKIDDNFPFYAEANKQNNFWVKKSDGSDYIGQVWPGLVKFPNFLKTDVRTSWANGHKVLFDKGVDGIWNDMNEPVVFGSPNFTMPLDNIFVADDGSQKTHAEVHNLYAHLENEATYNAFQTLKPNARPYILSRNAFAGSQRYTALWTGDNTTDWDQLRMTIPLNSNIGLSGMAFVGNDIGGFAKHRADGDGHRIYATPELFARWLEVGTFNALARIHYEGEEGKLDQTLQEPWSFGPEVENISRKYISLRYELLPYLYNAFQRAHESGAPVQKPLVYEFQNDPNTYNLDDQFMFGDSLMVAPVVQEGATSRSVYLPAGTKWVDYWTGEEFEGGQTITKQADLGTMPLYVKQDSIIPRREVQQYTGEKKLTNLILDTYLDNKAVQSFYQDDASTPDYKNGKYNVTDFHVENKGNHIEFGQDKKVQNYASDIQSYTLKLHKAVEPKKVQAANNKYVKASSLDEMSKQERAYFFDAKENVLYVKIPVNEQHKVDIQTKDDVNVHANVGNNNVDVHANVGNN